jgi:hypothetical protein
MAKHDSRAVYIRAFQHGGYWTLKVGVDLYDSEGTADEVLTLREVSQVPSVDTAIDQAWLIAVQVAHLLEREGATGRVAGADWPALPI